jgi:hypothetical protein
MTLNNPQRLYNSNKKMKWKINRNEVREIKKRGHISYFILSHLLWISLAVLTNTTTNHQSNIRFLSSYCNVGGWLHDLFLHCKSTCNKTTLPVRWWCTKRTFQISSSLGMIIVLNCSYYPTKEIRKKQEFLGRTNRLLSVHSNFSI